MFKKKPTIKTLSPLRSSDRRKVADRIIADCNLQPPSNETNTNEPHSDATSSLSALRKSLLPENALSAKFTTTSGPQLKEVNGIVYVGGHGSSDQRILWVKINETLYPSVYTLWQNPRILPLLHTPSFVVGKLQGGADLMTPGLAGPPFPEGANKGNLVAIASTDNPSVPVVVGTCVIDVSHLRTTQGVKGHAVETFHWAGDELWDWSTSGKPGTAIPDELPGWLEDRDRQLAEAAAGQMTIEDEEDDNRDGGVVLESTEDGTPKDSKAHNHHVEGEDAFAEVVEDKGRSGSEMTVQEIDEAFLNAFIYGVYQQTQTVKDDAKHGLKFPLTQSSVMSNLVLPFLPTFTPEQTAALQIKKTSWKNARKFIIALGNKKLLLAKESKNEAIVRDIDFEDQLIKEFVPYRLPKKDTPGPSVHAQASKPDANDADDAIGQQLKIQNLYRPKDSLSTILKGPDSSKGSYYTATDIRRAVTSYIENNHLVSESNKRLVTLDPQISNAVLSASNAVDRDVLAKGSIPRDALIERIVSICMPFHLILRNAESLEGTSAKPKPGTAPEVGIIMETRGGNKTATRVFGFEAYFISPQPLADELRKTCAGSTSVEPFKGGKGMEVMVQGPQKDAVIKALEKRGVNKQWVEVTDKTKGKKK